MVAPCLLAGGIPFMCLHGFLLALGVLPALFSCGKSWLPRGGREQPEKCLFAGARAPSCPLPGADEI